MKGKTGLSKPLESFLQVLCFFWFLTLSFGYIGKYLLYLPEEDWYPFFLRQARFSDFTIFQERFRHFHEARFFQLAGYPFTYPAPVAVVFDGFYRFGSLALDVYISFCFVVFICAGFALGRAMGHRGVGIVQAVALIGPSMLLSYPFWFLVDRANIEMVNWLLVALGVTAYWNKRWYLAGAFFGVAISFKIFPIMFLGLLLSARRYRETAWGIGVCAFTTYSSTYFMGPTYRLASEGIAKGLEFFRMQYVLQAYRSEIGFDHSAFTIIKEVAITNHIALGVSLLPWLYAYIAASVAVGAILFFGRIRILPRPNQVLALTVVSILLPPVSGDYTLVHLYIPWGVLVLVSISLKDAQKVRGLVFSFICMAFVMAPEGFFIIDGIRFAGQLKAIVLVVLFIVSISCPFEEPAADSDDKRLIAVVV